MTDPFFESQSAFNMQFSVGRFLTAKLGTLDRRNPARYAGRVLAARTARGILASPLASQNRKGPVVYPSSEKMARKIQRKFARLKFGCAEFASRPPSLNEQSEGGREGGGLKWVLEC